MTSYTEEQAAGFLQLPKKIIVQMAIDGILSGQKINGYGWRFSQNSLNSFLDKPATIEKEKYTWEQTKNRYLSDHKDLKSMSDVVWHLNKIHPYLESFTLDTLDKKPIDQFIDDRRKDKNRYGNPLSDSTINRTLQTIRAVLFYARDVLEWIDEIPKIHLFKEKKREFDG